MLIGSVFENNRTQAVRLPVDVRFSEGIKKVLVRKLGKERILTPIENTWDSFFLSDESTDDDFLGQDFQQNRAEFNQQERESLDD